MGCHIKISVNQGVIRAVYRGKMEYDANTEMLREVGKLAAANNSERVLFDLREADTQNVYVDAVRHAEEAPSLGIQRTFQIAILGARGNPILPHLENMTVNRGYLVKTFTDESEALAWLAKGDAHDRT